MNVNCQKRFSIMYVSRNSYIIYKLDSIESHKML